MALAIRSGVVLVVTKAVRVRTLMRDGQAEPVGSLVTLATNAAEAEQSNRDCFLTANRRAAGASRKQVEEAMAAHVISTAELMGRYARQR
jgi:hypothetical protein